MHACTRTHAHTHTHLFKHDSEHSHMRHEVQQQQQQQQQRLVEQNHNSLPVATPSFQSTQPNSCTLARKEPFCASG